MVNFTLCDIGVRIQSQRYRKGCIAVLGYGVKWGCLGELECMWVVGSIGGEHSNHLVLLIVNVVNGDRNVVSIEDRSLYVLYVYSLYTLLYYLLY